MHLWDLGEPGSSPIDLLGLERGVATMAITPNGRWLIASEHHGGDTCVWDLTAKDIPATSRKLEGGDVTDHCYSLSVDGSSRLLAVAIGIDVWLWDLKQEERSASPRVIRGLDKEGVIWRVAISPDGRWLFIGRHNRTAQLWNLTSEPEFKGHELTGHGGIQCVAISPDSRWLAGGTRKDGYLWDLTSPEPASTARVLAGHTEPIWSIRISADSRWLITDSSDGTIRRWDLNPKSLLERAETSVGRELTDAEKQEYQVP